MIKTQKKAAEINKPALELRKAKLKKKLYNNNTERQPFEEAVKRATEKLNEAIGELSEYDQEISVINYELNK